MIDFWENGFNESSTNLGDEHIELQRKEIIEVKRLLNEEIREKEAVQKTANELRNMVKKAEGEKTELARLLQDSRQKAAGTINPRSRKQCCLKLIFFFNPHHVVEQFMSKLVEHHLFVTSPVCSLCVNTFHNFSIFIIIHVFLRGFKF